jgi:hypothetical protein
MSQIWSMTHTHTNTEEYCDKFRFTLFITSWFTQIGVFYQTLLINSMSSSCQYSKTCLKRNAIVPVFFSVFTGFRFIKGCVLIKQSTKKYNRVGLQ